MRGTSSRQMLLEGATADGSRLLRKETLQEALALGVTTGASFFDGGKQYLALWAAEWVHGLRRWWNWGCNSGSLMFLGARRKVLFLFSLNSNIRRENLLEFHALSHFTVRHPVFSGVRIIP